MTEMLLIAAGIILIGGLVALSRVRRWTTLATARGDNISELEAKNSFLQSHNIRSRVAADNAPAPASGFASAGTVYAGGPASGSAGVARLEVKPSEKDEAERVLADFEHERMLHTDRIL